MKRILLTSTALIALGGTAFAESHASDHGVNFSGDAEFGHNDEFKGGVYWSLGLGVSASTALDNGLTAAMSGDITVDSTSGNTLSGGNVAIDDLKVSLSSDTASLTFGDTAPAADVLWSGVTNMDYDGFNDEGDFGEDAVLIGQMDLGSNKLAVSYAVDDANSTTSSDDLDQLQVGFTGSAGSLDYGLAYQDDADGTATQIVGVFVGTTLGGADVKLAYADADGMGSSLGVQASYPVGDVTVKVFYVMEDANTGTNDDNYGLEVSYASGPLSIDALYHGGGDEDMQINLGYDMGNGLNIFAGYRDNGSDNYDVTYIGADYDLGGGATARVSYAEVGGAGSAAATKDELGKAEDVLEGTTVEVSFAF